MKRGTTPPETAGEHEAARWVRDMFSRVVPRYDLLNHLLSANFDRRWRARTVRRLRPVLSRPDARIMDLCCGTGDLLLALQNGSARAVLGSDFSHAMLVAARHKIARKRAPSILVEADALALPIPDASLDLVTVAFGFRNLANYEKGLQEMRRVLRSGGTAAILEFSQPPNRLLAALYRFYSRRVLPAVGGAVSGHRAAYEYLPESVAKFPGPDELADAILRAGFSRVEYALMTGGIVALHTGDVA
jgi:demethylmenaquinone methyltransferase/2-methoxy-6-polyprenyl-1,4-benzoquinol methylase